MKRITGSSALFLVLAFIFVNSFLAATTSGADFLRIPKSARAIGVGETSSGIYGDPTGVEYNPACACSVSNMAFSVMYQNWIAGTYGIYALGIFRLGPVSLGASAYYLDDGGFTSYDSWAAQNGQYYPHELFVRAIAGLDGGMFLGFLKGLSLGCSGTFIERYMTDGPTFGGMLDLGATYRFTLGQLGISREFYFARIPITCGISGQNLGYAVDSITPMKMLMGVNAEIITNLLLSMEWAVEYGRPVQFNMGVEYTFFDIVSVRAGFNLGNNLGNVALGIGVRIPLETFNVSVDYAFSPMSTLGNNNCVSLNVAFPPTPSEYDKLIQKAQYHTVKGEYDLAKFYLEKAMELDKGNQEIQDKINEIDRKSLKVKYDLLYQRGVYHFSRGEYAEARKCWVDALELFPNEEDVNVRQKIEELDKLLSMEQNVESSRTNATVTNK